MDRSVWLSILLVLLAVAFVVSGRVAMDAAKGYAAHQQLGEIEALAGAPPSPELAERVTATAGCVYGFRPPVRACWYVWADPSEPAYLAGVATRVRSEATTSAVAWGAGALLTWGLALLSAWKASRPRRPYRPVTLARHVAAHPPGGRLTP